jgi:hypothetical protein
MSRLAWLAAVGLLVWGDRSAQAQNLTVQQPAVGSFNATTTVSVPDRGRAFIGGVGTAGSSRSQYGPVPFGTNSGSFSTYSGLSTGVTIQDFEALDRAALDRAATSQRHEQPLSGRAEQAYQTLHARHTGRAEREQSSRSSEAGSAATERDAPEVQAERARASYQRGLEAEQRGAVEVAKVHFRLAKRFGSQAAATRLGAPAKPKAVPR